MIAKLMKFLSGIAALAGRKPDQPCDHDISKLRDNKLVVLEEKCSSLWDANATLIRERRELRKCLQQAESMSDADRGNEHAAELDRVKSILRDRHGLSVSRSQIADAVEDLSKRVCQRSRPGPERQDLADLDRFLGTLDEFLDHI